MRLIKKTLLFVTLAALIIPTVLVGVIYWKQEAIVQYLLIESNKSIAGKVTLNGSHIAPFANFPYISIDLEDLRIFEEKSDTAKAIVHIKDAYIGFDLWTIVNGNMQIKSIKLSDGSVQIDQDSSGVYNIEKAFISNDTSSSSSASLRLALKSIHAKHIDIRKFNQTSGMLVDLYIDEAHSKFNKDDQQVFTDLDTEFQLSILQNGDSTFLRNKDFSINTEITFDKPSQQIWVAPTTVKIEDSNFQLGGIVGLDKDLYVDLSFKGDKPNFDLVIALAPDDLAPVLKRYENQGRVYFDATVKGPTIHGQMPAIDARFGCENAFIHNYEVNKKLDALQFNGTFTNGSERSLRTMALSVNDFSARPEIGHFTGNLQVVNFEAPDIHLQLNSAFELEFLSKFFNLEGFTDLKGHMDLSMNFKDIIDLDDPTKALQRFNESYFTQLKIENLSFRENSFGPPIHDIDMYAEMNGHAAEIKYCNARVGNSDLDLHALISDLPAIIHHTDIPVEVDMDLKSNYLDFFELTGGDTLTSFNEQVENLALNLRFISSARAFTESPHLPMGEFFVDNLYAKFKRYPHTLHDFHADIIIEEEDLSVIDFKGIIDESDFHFNGKLKHYDIWFAEKPMGKTSLEFTIDSRLLQLHDLFSYNGANYVPEEYRHEELGNLIFHANCDLLLDDSIRSVDLTFDRFDASMKLHPLRFEKFRGKIHLENDHLTINDFTGKMGRTDFAVQMDYYVGDDIEQSKNNRLDIISKQIMLDELLVFDASEQAAAVTASASPAASGGAVTSNAAHDAGFNIYELPFGHWSFTADVDDFHYGKYHLRNLKSNLRITPDHYLYVDEFSTNIADGKLQMKGYFNGSNPQKIYFDPTIQCTNIALDKIMIKFDNFGQDHLVAQNLHGNFTGTISGHIRMHRDLVPQLDDSEIHMDFQVTKGRLQNYPMLQAMADYFKDKNINDVRFDTLQNRIDLTRGLMTIPMMAINSSIGHLEISGKQDMNFNMDYKMRIPWRMVSSVAANKLFGRKKEEVDETQVDEIQYAGKRERYIEVFMKGTPDKYDITLGKKFTR